MAVKAIVSSSLASSKDRPTLALEAEHLHQIADVIAAAGRAVDTQKLVKTLVESLETVASSPEPVTERVKRYDHRCNYEEGERVFVDNRYGKSFATVTNIIRQPPQAFCDKAFLEFDDAGYRSRWEHERSTPYFAIHSGRTNADAVYIETESAPKSAQSRLNASAIVRLGKALDKALASDERFQKSSSGWLLAGMAPVEAPTRPHISSERGGVPPRPIGSSNPSGAHSQGSYKGPLLEVIDLMGEATIEDIKRNIQKNLTLGPDDWVADSTGKIVWLHRLHAAIKHLKRVGAIDSPRREVYRRVVLRRESA